MNPTLSPGTVLQLKGSHSISKPVPNGFNHCMDEQGDKYKTIKEGDIVLVLGYASYPWNKDEYSFKYDETYPTLSIMIDGEYYVIRQTKLLCYLYKKVSE